MGILFLVSGLGKCCVKVSDSVRDDEAETKNKKVCIIVS